jgi:hypothetical protein
MTALLRTGLLAGLLAGLAFAGRPADPPAVALPRLLEEMVDLVHLAEYPDPPFTTRQFSSFERLSDTPSDPATWFANHDRGFCYYEAVVKEQTPCFRDGPQQGRPADGVFSKGAKVGIARNRPALGDYVWVYAAEDRRKQGYVSRSSLEMNVDGPVLAEMEGPGCLVHFWAANPGDGGRVRIYIDRAELPAIDAPLSELLGGTWQAQTADQRFIPFPPPLAGERGRGWNLYFPIAYAKHCKVVAQRPGLAYHIVYRTYPAWAAMESFTPGAVAARRKELDEIRTRCFEPRQARGSFADQPAETWAPQPIQLPPSGRHTQTLELPGGQAGALFAQQWRASPLTPAVLAGVLLKISFDDNETPAVLCPLGAFFGTTPGADKFSAFPSAITEDGRLQSFWLMPFQKQLHLELENHSGQAVTLTPTFRLMPRPWSPRTMYFHARWRCDENLPTRPYSERTRCQLEGQGVYVGTMLSVHNPAQEWWGEGDEKIYLDGGSFPAWFGTGTDDYFGAAWADANLFQHAYHGRTRQDAPDHQGYTSFYRFHLLDALPFTKSFRFDQELIHWSPRARLTVASVSYWYARPGSKDRFPTPTIEQLRSWIRPLEAPAKSKNGK